MKVEEFERLRGKIERLREKKARAEGALEQSLRRLFEKLDVVSIEEAEKKLAELKRESEESELAFDEKSSEFEKRWGDRLKGTS